MQTKVVVAYKEGNLSKVRKLQYQLIMSFEARALAVRRVTSSDGRNTPGIDLIIWNNPRHKFKAIAKLRLKVLHFKKYKPNLIKRIRIPKQDSDKLRPLGIPTMLDRALQALIVLSIDPIVEEISDRHSYGFRKHRSAHDAVNRVRSLLDKRTSPKYILDVDIENCFDTISHDFILNELKFILCSPGRTLIKG
jgi:RNA-directed DNA polymerase